MKSFIFATIIGLVGFSQSAFAENQFQVGKGYCIPSISKSVFKKATLEGIKADLTKLRGHSKVRAKITSIVRSTAQDQEAVEYLSKKVLPLDLSVNTTAGTDYFVGVQTSNCDSVLVTFKGEIKALDAEGKSITKQFTGEAYLQSLLRLSPKW